MVAPLIAAAGGAVIGGARALAMGGGALLRAGGTRAAAGAEGLLTRRAVSGAIDTEEGLQRWLEDMLIDEVNQKAKQIFEAARQNTPKGETGQLQQGWRVKYINQVMDKAEVWNIEDYASYVEYDTRNTRGRYMLTNAIARVMI